MSTRQKAWLIGCAAGVIGASAGCGSAMILSKRWATPVAFAVAALTGGYAANLAAEELARRVREHLGCLGSNAPKEPIGMRPLDDDFVAVRAGGIRATSRSRRLERRYSSRNLVEAREIGSKTSVHSRVNCRATRSPCPRRRSVFPQAAENQSRTVARTAHTVESLSEKIDAISTHAEDAASAAERARRGAERPRPNQRRRRGDGPLGAQRRGQRPQGAAIGGPFARRSARSSN